MIESTDLFVFIAALVAVYLLPGPDMALVLSVSAFGGQRSGLMAAVGLALELCRAEPEGSCDQMAQALMQALRQDPYLGEDYHQWLMRCLAQSEGVYAAIEHYRRLIHFLQAHLGDRPLEETRDLAERIRGGEAVLCRPPEQRPHGIDCPLTLNGACQLWPEGGERDVS